MSKPEWYCDEALLLYLPPPLKLTMDAVESSTVLLPGCSVSRDLFQRKVFHCTKSSNFKAKFYSKAVVRANTHCIKCNCLWTIEALSLVKHLTFPNSDCNRLVTIFIIPDLVCSISLLSPPDSPSFLSLSCLKNCRLFYHLIWLSDYKRFREIIGSVVLFIIVSLCLPAPMYLRTINICHVAVKNNSNSFNS